MKSAIKWLASGRLLVQSVSWTATFFTVRLLSPTDYGLFAMAAVFVSFAGLFEELGLRQALIQRTEWDHGFAQRAFGMSILISLTISGLLIVASPWIAAVFGLSELGPLVIALSFQFLLGAFGVVPSATIHRSLSFRPLAAMEVACALLTSTLVLLMAWSGYGVWSLICGSLAGTLLRVVGLQFLAPFRARPSFSVSGMGSALSYGGLISLQRVLWWFQSQIDHFLVGKFHGPIQLGVYSVALNIASLPQQKLGSIVVTATFSGISRVAHDRDQVNHLYLRAASLLSVTMFPVFFGISATAADMVPIVLGDRWLAAAPLIELLALIIPFRMLNTALSESLNAIGRPQTSLLLTAVMTVAIVSGICIGLPWDLIGVARGWVGSYLAAFAFSMLLGSRVLGFPLVDFMRQWAPAAAASAGMYAIVWYARGALPYQPGAWQGLLSVVVMGAIAYPVLLAVLDPKGMVNLARFLRRT